MAKNTKKILIIIIVIALLTTVFLVVKLNSGKEEIKIQTGTAISNDLVTMTVKENTISKTGAEFILKSHTKIEHEYTYGEYFKLERKKNEKWVDVKPIIKNFAFNLIGYTLLGNETKEISIKWEWLYGELPPGEYRITKSINYFRGSGDFDKYFISAEFSI